MLTFIAFILTIIGCINWLLIGLLQYDFIAGLFGFQASIFSRLCYIIIGAGCLYLIIRIIINKGILKIYEKKKKQKLVASVEAGKEANFVDNKENNSENKPNNNEKLKNGGLFDENLKK